MIKIGIMAFTAVCFSWLRVVLQQCDVKAASLRAQIVWSWRVGLYFMRNGAGLDYFIICFILSDFMKTQVPFSPLRYLLCIVTMELFNQFVLWSCLWVTSFFHTCLFKRKICLEKETWSLGSAFSTYVLVYGSSSQACIFTIISQWAFENLNY